MIETLTRDKSYRKRYQRLLDFIWRSIVFINRYAYSLSDEDSLLCIYLDQGQVDECSARVDPPADEQRLEDVFCPLCGFPVSSYRRWAEHGCREPRGAVEVWE